MFPFHISDKNAIIFSIVILVTVSMAAVFGIASAVPNTHDYSHKSGTDALYECRYIQDSRANVSVRSSQTGLSGGNDLNSISQTLTETTSKTAAARIILNTTNRTAGIVGRTTHLTTTIIETTNSTPNTTNETTRRHLINKSDAITEELNDTVEGLPGSDDSTDQTTDTDHLGDDRDTNTSGWLIDGTNRDNRPIRRWIESHTPNKTTSIIPNETSSISNETPPISNETPPISNETSITPDGEEIVDSSNDSVSAPIDDDSARTIGNITDTDGERTTAEQQQQSPVSTTTPTASDRERGHSTPKTTAENTHTANTEERPPSATESPSTNDTTDALTRASPNDTSNTTQADTTTTIGEVNDTVNTEEIAENGSKAEQYLNVLLSEVSEIPLTPASTPKTGVAVGVTVVAIRIVVRQGSIIPETVSSSISVSNTGLLPTIRASFDTHVVDPLSRMFTLFRYSRYDDSDPLEHDGRARVFKTIEDTPGVYLSAVSQQTEHSLSTIRHHLRVLEQENLVMSVKVHGKRRFYPTDSEQVELTAVLDDEATANVIEALCRLGPTSVSNLADELDRDPSTVTHHLQRLNEDGIVHRERDGRTVMNHLSPNARAMLTDSTTDGLDQSVFGAD